MNTLDLVFQSYGQLVEEHTRKGPSYLSDILISFRGVLSVLKEYSGWTFAFGLPEQFIKSAILWIINNPTARRDNTNPNEQFSS
jgi:hypothetical protein